MTFKMKNKIKHVEKLWGSEDWIVNNKKYCGKILNLKSGFQSSLHSHKNKHETFYLLEGKVLLELGNELRKTILNVGESAILEPGTKHRFIPLENSRIIEFSTHHEDSDTYRDTESGKVDVDKLIKELKIK